VTQVAHLLEHGGTAAGREKLAATAGVSEKLVLEWVNHADLMRIDGVGSEYADLLEAAGVDSVPELATRNATNLAAALEKANAAKDLVRRVPSETVVAKWVAEAKTLPRAVHH
jgi:predicted flap endonuclease-1-like 5' DNA nuclease